MKKKNIFYLILLAIIVIGGVAISMIRLNNNNKSNNNMSHAELKSTFLSLEDNYVNLFYNSKENKFYKPTPKQWISNAKKELKKSKATEKKLLKNKSNTKLTNKLIDYNISVTTLLESIIKNGASYEGNTELLKTMLEKDQSLEEIEFHNEMSPKMKKMNSLKINDIKSDE